MVPQGWAVGTPHGSLPIPGSSWPCSPTPGFAGPQSKRLLPTQLLLPWVLQGPSCEQQRAPGIIAFKFCIIKLPWLFPLETFTIPCLAGKDDCSKPKLGINYTTTLHFSYKGKLCGKSCESTSFLCPPSEAGSGWPPTLQTSQENNTKQAQSQPQSQAGGCCPPPGHAFPHPLLPTPCDGRKMQEQAAARANPRVQRSSESCICVAGR